MSRDGIYTITKRKVPPVGCAHHEEGYELLGLILQSLFAETTLYVGLSAQDLWLKEP